MNVQRTAARAHLLFYSLAFSNILVNHRSVNISYSAIADLIIVAIKKKEWDYWLCSNLLISCKNYTIFTPSRSFICPLSLSLSPALAYSTTQSLFLSHHSIHSFSLALHTLKIMKRVARGHSQRKNFESPLVRNDKSDYA
jgi:hypothetical protein